MKSEKTKSDTLMKQSHRKKLISINEIQNKNKIFGFFVSPIGEQRNIQSFTSQFQQVN